MKKVRDIPDKSHEASLICEIPYELQIEILTKLPVKSLMRFKSVSKIWSSIICSQFFTDRYLKVSSPSSLRVYMWSSLEDSPHNKMLLLSSSSFVYDQKLIGLAVEGYSVSHVYRGLVCFVNLLSAQIYNTCTRQLVALPDIEKLTLDDEDDEDEAIRMIVYYIGFDPVHNQYKVVCSYTRFGPVIRVVTEIWVLLLGGDGCSQWRKISDQIDDQPHHPFQRKGSSCLIINGVMYYFADVQQQHHHLPHFIPMLMSIDLGSEEIRFLQKPQHSDSANLIEFNGKVGLLDSSGLKDHGVMNLWVMEDEEKQIWSSKALVLDPCQIHGITLGTTRNGEVIFAPDKFIVKPQSNTPLCVFLYNIQNNALRIVRIIDSSTITRTRIRQVFGLDDLDNLIHL